MPRSLADGRTRVAILTTAPADPTAPTKTELDAGLNAAGQILASDFEFSLADSDRVSDMKPLDQETNQESLGPSNTTVALTLFRYFDVVTGDPDDAEETVYEAVKDKGTELWIYARETGASSKDAWAVGDEIYLGAHVITDSLQRPTTTGGYIRRRLSVAVQDSWPNLVVAAGGGG